MPELPDDARDEIALALIEHLVATGKLGVDDTSAIADRLDAQGFTMKAGYVRAVPFVIAAESEPPPTLRSIQGGKASVAPES